MIGHNMLVHFIFFKSSLGVQYLTSSVQLAPANVTINTACTNKPLPSAKHQIAWESNGQSRPRHVISNSIFLRWEHGFVSKLRICVMGWCAHLTAALFKVFGIPFKSGSSPISYSVTLTIVWITYSLIIDYYIGVETLVNWGGKWMW